MTTFGTRDGFLKVFDELRDELLSELPGAGMTPEVMKNMKEMMDYNIPGGKLNRGLTVVHTLEAILGAAVTDEAAHKAAVLGWALEWLQAYFLIADDIMDASPTRRGQPCWYKLPHIGMIAINDAFVLHSQMFSMIKRHFGKTPEYGAILDIFLDTTWRTELGQGLDLTSAPLPGMGDADLDRFTIERYRLIVLNKTAYYSFHLPVVVGLILAGLGDAAAAPGVEQILLRMGEYFQIQDDYLDCYADAAVLGKIGTDIQDNKCGWLVVQALATCNDTQRAELKLHYGKHNVESIAAVKAVYKELNLEKRFEDFEATSHAELLALIDTVVQTTPIPRTVFTTLLAKIYKRAK